MPRHMLNLLVCLTLVTVTIAQQTSKIRINQVGYEVQGPKFAVYQGDPADLSNVDTFTLCDTLDNIVYTGTISDPTHTIEGWQGVVMQGHGENFTRFNFSDFQEPGTYYLQCKREQSFTFVIDTNMLFKSTFPEQLNCYKKMRYLGEEDRSLKVQGSNERVDIFGGYKEASGDASKHFTHLQYANYIGGQENPMLTWVLLRTLEQNKATIEELTVTEQLLEEVAFGADYLMRSQHADGWFYTTIFNFWDETKERTVCAYEAALLDNSQFTNITIQAITDDYRSAFRTGGGIAIAALAKTGAANISSNNYTAEQYLEAAIKGYEYIKENNKTLCYNGKANIIDDYCALIAAIELYKATEETKYKTDADLWAENIIRKQQAEGWFTTEDGTLRPYYHAAEEGLPLISLIYYLTIAPEKKATVTEVVQKNINWYLQISAESNPFNAAKLYAAPYENEALQEPRVSYFMPKRNETGYWYQGENARLASLSTAFLSAATLLKSIYTLESDSLSTLALDQLNWILGKNPFEVCMLYGFGEINSPDYPTNRQGKRDRKSIKGGICNGISTSTRPSDWEDVEYIEWAPYEGSSWIDWRWIEQWLPHEFWFSFATSTLSEIVLNGDTPVEQKSFQTTMKPLHLRVSNTGKEQYTLTLNRNLRSPHRLEIISPKGVSLYRTTLSQNVATQKLSLPTIATGIHIIKVVSEENLVLTQRVFLQ